MTTPVNTPVANHILRRIWLELAEVYAPGSLGSSATLRLNGPVLLVRTPDGHTVAITAAELAADDPAVVALEASVRAIEAGDVV
jgi:hypothetical protein